MIPGPIYTYVATFLAALALGFGGGWKVQNWRLGGQIATIKAQQSESLAEATREARTTESRRSTQLQEAQNAATKRATTARLDADNARSELDRLRQSIADAAGGVPGESASACTERAVTGRELLAQCAGAYQDLAATADRLNADRLMLVEAWPK